MTLHTLYLCYFGLREPLVQTQVLPYLRQLVAAGVTVSLLTFEPVLWQKRNVEELEDTRARLTEQGIRWHSLTYHKRPSIPATMYDILAGARLAARLIRQEGVEILHARAHVPMAMAMLASLKARCHIIFDFRGLMAEEYRDAGVWTTNSLPFRMVKKLERAGLRRADQVVVLTSRMRDWLASEGLVGPEKIEVIPCCVDFSRYDTTVADWGDESAGETRRFEVVYAGAVTGLYLLEEMGRFFLEIRARRPGALLRVLTTGAPEAAAEVLRRAGLSENDFWIGGVSPHEVPRYLQRAHLGLSFRKPTFSQLAASPTKIAEYLAAGLPVVSNAGIGDVDDLLQTKPVGVVVRDFTAAEFARAADAALALAGDARTHARCVEVGRLHFDLRTVGGNRYLRVYRQIASARRQTR